MTTSTFFQRPRWRFRRVRAASVLQGMCLAAVGLAMLVAAAGSMAQTRAGGGAGARCTDVLQPADRKRFESRYDRRVRTHGKAHAEAWLAEQGRLHHRRLMAQGICPPDAAHNARQARQADEARARPGCRKTMRPVPMVGGGMTLGETWLCPK